MLMLLIDWAKVNWIDVGAVAVLGLVGAVLGNLLAFGNRVFGPILTGILVGVLFVAWTYWLHSYLVDKHILPPVPA